MLRPLLVLLLLNVAILPSTWVWAQDETTLPYFDDLAVTATAGDATTLGDYGSGAMDGAASDTCCEECREGLCGGWILPSDHCFDDFISPMTNPVFVEDPRTLTEARLIYLRH